MSQEQPKVSVDKDLQEIKDRLERTRQELAKAEQDFSVAMESNFHASLWKGIHKDEIINFVKKPYLLQPYKDEWRLYVPSFIPLEVGWLEYSTESYRVFRVNRYVDWLTPLPDIVREDIGLEKPEVDLKFNWDTALATLKSGDAAVVKRKYGKFIKKQIDDKTFQIKNSRKFSFILDLLRDGVKYFELNPVDQSDFYPNERAKFQLRDYQQDAWKEFLRYSHIGVFYPFGAGKSFLGLYAVSKIKGNKLIVVPNNSLRETWEKRIKEMIPDASKDEYTIVTYQSAKKEWIRRKEYSLVVFDEVHHLPAPVFSLFSFIKRRYTLGLSGSPYREDGDTKLIFTLTGQPIGADWNYFWKRGVVKKPAVRVIIVDGYASKLVELATLLKEKSTTLVFCDSISKGKQLASKFNTTFVSGETRKRLDAIDDALDKNDVVIVSRVGDEGISLPELQRVIEFDMLFGSRRQEAQRAGRLFHATEVGEHIVMMTTDEYDLYKKRLYALAEKGLEIKMENKT